MDERPGEQNSGQEKPDNLETPARTNIIITPLEGEELARARCEDLASPLKSFRKTNEATFKFFWKGISQPDYVENEHMMEAKGTLNPLDGSVKLEGAGWSATINPDGTIDGNMPKKLLEFLSYNKLEYDEGSTHKVEFIKQGLGNSGDHAISVIPIYRDTEGENAEDVLKSLDDPN